MKTASKGGRQAVSFFGGDPNVSHFTVGVHYRFPEESWDSGNREAYLNAGKRRREQRDRLKEVGFKKPYFQFRNKDEQGKAEAKAKAEAFAVEWSAKVGFELEVAEGFSL